MATAAGTLAQPTTTTSQNRIDEHDADYRRLHAATVARLESSIRTYVRELRASDGDAHRTASAASRFIQRHTALLRDAYHAGWREGQRDYYGAVSAARDPHDTTAPSDEQAGRRLAFYAPSVAKMAAEGLRAYQESQTTPRLSERATEAYLLAAGDGYNPYRDNRGRFAPGPHAERMRKGRPPQKNIIERQREVGHPFYRAGRSAVELRADHQRLEGVAKGREATATRAAKMQEAAQRKASAESERFAKLGGYRHDGAKPEGMTWREFGRLRDEAKAAHEAAQEYASKTYQRAGRARAYANEARYQADRAKALSARAAHPVENPYHPDMKALSRAKTTEDVERWLKSTYKDTEFALGGAHPTAAKRLAAEIADLAAQHPEAMKTLQFVGTADDARSAPYLKAHGLDDGGPKGWAGSYDNEGSHSILLNDLAVGDPRSAQRVFNHSAKVGWTAAEPGITDSASYNMRHEFGHHLAYHLRDYGSPEARAAVERMQNEMSNEHSGRPLGGYASTLREEHFAEAFAAMKYGGEARQRDPYVQELYDMLQAYG